MYFFQKLMDAYVIGSPEIAEVGSIWGVNLARSAKYSPHSSSSTSQKNHIIIVDQIIPLDHFKMILYGI
jgi:hypothetical protein